MNSFVRFLYQLARASNQVNIYSQALSGKPTHLLKHFRNKMFFRAFGKYLR